MGDKKAEGSFTPVILVMLASMIIAFYWEKLNSIRAFVHWILDPTAGVLLNWNLTFGMFIIVFIIAVITTLVQKYATDQKTLKKLKNEQKKLQKEMQEVKNHPEKLMELQKKQFEFMPRMMKLSMRPVMFTGVPFILFFRWFMDFFNALGNPKLLGFFSWFWFYLIFTMIFSGFIRKWMKVV